MSIRSQVVNRLLQLRHSRLLRIPDSTSRLSTTFISCEKEEVPLTQEEIDQQEKENRDYTIRDDVDDFFKQKWVGRDTYRALYDDNAIFNLIDIYNPIYSYIGTDGNLREYFDYT